MAIDCSIPSSLCYEELPGHPSSPFVIACDHAGRATLPDLGDLGVSHEDWQSHIAWDIGIAGVARLLAESLGAHVFLQNHSRLLIDCNRPLDSSTSIVTVSANVPVPGNLGLSVAEIERRRDRIFRPYHQRITSVVDERIARNTPTVFVALHSFTPVFCGSARPWHAGVLHHHDVRLAQPLLEAMRKDGRWVVGDNEPYRVTDHSDYSVLEYGMRRGLRHVELEIRQDLIAEPEGQRLWAVQLARWLPQAIGLEPAVTTPSERS
jgi:predicted N-formylglutamate amidohydrolase